MPSARRSRLAQLDQLTTRARDKRHPHGFRAIARRVGIANHGQSDFDIGLGDDGFLQAVARVFDMFDHSL